MLQQVSAVAPWPLAAAAPYQLPLLPQGAQIFPLSNQLPALVEKTNGAAIRQPAYITQGLISRSAPSTRLTGW